MSGFLVAYNGEVMNLHRNTTWCIMHPFPIHTSKARSTRRLAVQGCGDDHQSHETHMKGGKKSASKFVITDHSRAKMTNQVPNAQKDTSDGLIKFQIGNKTKKHIGSNYGSPLIIQKWELSSQLRLAIQEMAFVAANSATTILLCLSFTTLIIALPWVTQVPRVHLRAHKTDD